MCAFLVCKPVYNDLVIRLSNKLKIKTKIGYPLVLAWKYGLYELAITINFYNFLYHLSK